MFCYAILRTQLEPHKKITVTNLSGMKSMLSTKLTSRRFSIQNLPVSVLQMSSTIAQFYQNQIMIKNEFISLLDVLQLFHHFLFVFLFKLSY